MLYTKEQAKEKIAQLIEKFKRETESGKVKQYNEAQTIDYYIRPLFEALGWDFENSDEVVPQEKVSKGWVDRGFSLDGIPKFYLEAKKFKEDLNNNTFAEQAINYAWLKSVTWAILTNFEGLKVFNAQWESTNPRDKIYIDLKWSEFLDKFDRIWLLSKNSFLNNELDKEAEEHGKKIKKTLVTPAIKQLFNDLMSWREKLTKNISAYSSNNKILKTEEELDESIQRIIDRLIFIRVCEDRGIEKIILQSKLREWQNGNHKKSLVDILNGVFREFDTGYNSKLFSPHPSENLSIDDIVLIEIINNLYESSDKVFKYDFNAIEADVLGNIYEEYLGYILKKTKKRSGIIENHAHRKDMGIYYTPTFVVDYIVKNTVGKLLEEINSDEGENIKVLDMACGSGSFLIKAFDTLSNYHRRKNELDFLRKKKILTNNIYGVDLDPKAIEIAQLNLLLKTLEKRDILPKLQDNLKVGDSLIDDSRISERALVWNKEFEKIILNKGFDVIVGNPPYVNMQLMAKETQEFFKNNYPEMYTGQNDILYYFIAKGLELLKENGKLGYIVSRYFLESKYAAPLRKFILDNSLIKTIIDFNNIQIFGKEVNVLTSIIILERDKSKLHKETNLIRIIRFKPKSKLKKEEVIPYVMRLDDKKNYSDDNVDIFEIKQGELSEESWFFSSPLIGKMKNKIENGNQKLSSFCEVGKGMETGFNEAFVVDLETAKKEKLEETFLRNYIKTKDLKKFKIINRNLEIIYLPEKVEETRIKNILFHLSKWKRQLEQRFDFKNGHCEWYSWGNLRNRELFEKNSEKIITPLYSVSNKFVYDSGNNNENYYTLTDTYIIVPKDKSINLKFILAILNSRLMDFYFKNNSKLKREGYYEYSGGSLENIPIKMVSEKQQKEIEQIVNKILDLNAQLQNINPESDRGMKLQEEISMIEKKIDKEIYDVYGLTQDEIKFVESI